MSGAPSTGSGGWFGPTGPASSLAREIGSALSESASEWADGDAKAGLAQAAESWFEVAEVLAGMGQ